MGQGLDTRVIEDPVVIAAGTAGDLLLQQVRQQIQAFIAKWEPYEPRFVEYFKAQWSGRAGGYGPCGLWVRWSQFGGRLSARSVERRRGLAALYTQTHTQPHTCTPMLLACSSYHTHTGKFWLSHELQMCVGQPVV